MDEKEILWPRKSMGRAISKIGVDQVGVTEEIGTEIHDATLDPGVGKQIVSHAPEIDLIGSEVVTDARSRIWGGVLVRALDKKDEQTGLRKRCLQYLYTYTLQRGGVSVSWNLIVPLLTLVLALAIATPSILPDVMYFDIFTDMVFNQAFSVFVIFLPLWLQPMFQHLSDWVRQDKKQFHMRGTTGQLIFGILPGGLVIWFEGSGNIIGTIAFAVFIFVYALFIVEYLLCLFGKGLTCHRMDFAPIYLYLNEVQTDKWEAESACWDYYHYGAVCEPHEGKKRLNLIMTDTWHSFSRKGFVNKAYTTLLGFLAVVGGAALLIASQFSVIQVDYPEVIGLFLIVIGVIMMSQRPLGGKKLSELSELSDPLFLSEHAHLTQEKLETLWRLKDPNAKLKITATLQDPFNNYPSKKGTFNDMEAEEPEEEPPEAPPEDIHEEEEIAESKAVYDISGPEAVETPPVEKVEESKPDYEGTGPDSKRLKIDPSRRLGHRPDEEEGE
ncbi:MAG: hypothetical protein RTU30_03905 [Candidatus Thorarchaeota archaeon]